MPPLSQAKVRSVNLASANAVQKQLPQRSIILDQLTPKSVSKERAKQWFKLLLASDGNRIILVSVFFKNLHARLGRALDLVTLHPKSFGFVDLASMSKYIKEKLASSELRADNVKEFLRGMSGRKWHFIGKILWERYIKYGPVRQYLDARAARILQAVNDEIKAEISNTGSYKMFSIRNKEIPIKSEFGSSRYKLPAAVEFILESDGRKEFIDFAHVAFNREGYWTMPNPTEIKLPWAAGGAPKQFSEYIGRLKAAKKLFAVFDEADYEMLKRQPGFKGVGTPGDGKVIVELNPETLVFAPRGLKHAVVQPSKDAWQIVKPLSDSPEVTLGLGETAKGVGSLFDKDPRFNFLKYKVDASRAPFEVIYGAIFSDE